MKVKHLVNKINFTSNELIINFSSINQLKSDGYFSIEKFTSSGKNQFSDRPVRVI